MADYDYSLSEDFSNGINLECLHNSIVDHGFATPFDGLNFEGDVVSVMFTGNLSPADQSELSTIISNHDPDLCPIAESGSAEGGVGDAESLVQSSTNSESPVQKLTLQCNDCPTGRYRVGWYYEFACSSMSDDFRARVQLDNTTDLMYHSQELKDPGTDQSLMGSGFAYINLTEGNHFIDLDYWAEDGDTSYISNARLEIWRVA